MSSIVSFLLLLSLLLSIIGDIQIVEASGNNGDNDSIVPFRAQFVPNHIKEAREKLVTAATLSIDGEPDDEVEILVRYKNPEGKTRAGVMGVNADDSVDQDISMFNTARVNIKRRDIEDLDLDDNIEAIGVNVHYQALPYTSTPSSIGANRKKTSLRHRLQELDLQPYPSEKDAHQRQLRFGGGEETPYGLGLVQADQLEQGPADITVCVVDTGYGSGHPDLPNEQQNGVKGYSPHENGSGGNRWNHDGHGHGSHCAGTIGAIGNNNIGVTSVNPNPDKFTFYIGKGLTDSGAGDTGSIVEAAQACVNNGAKIISMSLGCVGDFGCYSQIDEAAFRDIYNRGVLVIAASGNAGNSQYSYPASYPTVMSVGAVHSSKQIASFSQHNDQVEICAPGVDVTSTITANHGHSFDYATWSGTSMATPHVAGVAALVWSHFPECTNNQIRNVLLRTALGDEGCDQYYGYGIVQAKRAYDLLASEGCEAGGSSSGNPSDLAIGGCSQYEGPPAPPVDGDDPSQPDDPQDPEPEEPPQDRPGRPQEPPEEPEPPGRTPGDEVPTCSDDEVLVTMLLSTDKFGEETEWSIYDDDGNEVLLRPRGTYRGDAEYVEPYCVPTNACTFEIRDYPDGFPDGEGDGICCGIYGNGIYVIERNGVIHESPTGGRFGFKETIDICSGGRDPSPPPPGREEDGGGGDEGNDGGDGNGSGGCPGNEIEVHVTIVTDDNPEQTSWRVGSHTARGFVARSEPYTSQRTTYEQQTCLQNTGCYFFVIADTQSNGFSGSGSYTVTVDGQQIASNGSFGRTELTDFGPGC